MIFIVLGCLLVVVGVVYIVLVGGEWFDRAERELDWYPTETWTEPAEPHLRIVSGVYDWQVDPESDL